MKTKPVASREQELINATRAIERLRTQARKLRRQLKKVTADLRLERKHQRAMLMVMADPDIAPMRLFNGAVGLKAGSLNVETVRKVRYPGIFVDDNEEAK